MSAHTKHGGTFAGPHLKQAAPFVANPSPVAPPTQPLPSLNLNNDYTRFRSFAERYVVERAASFEKGKELEDGWRAVEDAKKLFIMIAEKDASF